MNHDLVFTDYCKKALPQTYALLQSSGLTVHDCVTHIVLHGSRGHGGGARPDSDIDLSLITDTGDLSGAELESLLKEVAKTTLDKWHGSIEPDIAVVFDKQTCGLKCFHIETWNETVCDSKVPDCFGIYKMQKGFSGIVENAGVDVKKMYPCMVIWARDQ